MAEAATHSAHAGHVSRRRYHIDALAGHRGLGLAFWPGCVPASGNRLLVRVPVSCFALRAHRSFARCFEQAASKRGRATPGSSVSAHLARCKGRVRAADASFPFLGRCWFPQPKRHLIARGLGDAGVLRCPEMTQSAHWLHKTRCEPVLAAPPVSTCRPHWPCDHRPVAHWFRAPAPFTRARCRRPESPGPISAIRRLETWPGHRAQKTRARCWWLCGWPPRPRRSRPWPTRR